MDSIQDRFLKNGDVELHFIEAGPPDGHLVVLLHGFPSFWYSWKHQIGPLAQRGYHVVAPDLRGYNLSSKPEDLASYGRDPVLSDVTALLDHCSPAAPKCTLVGHDWGGNIAWLYAQMHPECVARLVILNMPYPQSFQSALSSDLGQMQRSWYIFMFQLPSFPEKFISANNFKFLRRLIQDDPVFKQSSEVAQMHVDAFSRPGTLTAAINYYRATFKHWPRPSGDGKVLVPVLVLWGEKDYVFQPYLVDPPPERVPLATVIRFPEASHWVMWDEPDKVTNHIVQFIESGHNNGQKSYSRL